MNVPASGLITVLPSTGVDSTVFDHSITQHKYVESVFQQRLSLIKFVNNSIEIMIEKDRARVTIEKIKVKGGQVLDKVKEVIEEGDARRVSLHKDGRTLIEFPLTIGVGGATAAIFLAPTLAAIGAVAALVSDVELRIERLEPEEIEVEADSDEKEEETASAAEEA